MSRPSPPRQGSTPSTGRPVRPVSIRSPGASRPGSPRNLLMTNPLIRAWSAGLQQGERPVQGGEHATPVDVPDHDDGQPGRPGQPHVGDVGVPEVDLRRAARTLADDHVVLGPQVFEAVQGDLEQVPRVRAVLRGADLVAGLAEHDDVGAGVAARLEQHRVHPRVRLDACRRRLHGLGPADLGTVRGNEGVEGHVLGLERRDPDSLPGQPAAQPGGEHALPGVRGGPGDEQAALHGRIPFTADPWCGSAGSGRSGGGHPTTLGNQVLTVHCWPGSRPVSWDSNLLGQLRRATNPALLCVRRVTLALHNKLSGACSSVG